MQWPNVTDLPARSGMTRWDFIIWARGIMRIGLGDGWQELLLNGVFVWMYGDELGQPEDTFKCTRTTAYRIGIVYFDV
jgi:hypothetical protein